MYGQTEDIRPKHTAHNPLLSPRYSHPATLTPLLSPRYLHDQSRYERVRVQVESAVYAFETIVVVMVGAGGGGGDGGGEVAGDDIGGDL